MKKCLTFLFVLLFVCVSNSYSQTAPWFDKSQREENKKKELDDMQKDFEWWPSDAQPAPVPDTDRGGFWWWPSESNQSESELWGNRGYIYVYKIIYDYKAEDTYDETPPPVVAETPEPKPSLLIKKIIKNVKIYFDYNKANLREDHAPILENAVKSLNKNPEASVLITGNCDVRGSDEYNMRLGKKRADVVKEYMLDHGIEESRIKIISRGKLDSVAPVKDLVGMQKDRNAQFMVAEVEEVMIPAGKAPASLSNATPIEEGKYIVEEEKKIESGVKVSTREYTIQKGDSFWKIAEKELGNGNRWKYLYELNKDRIKDPNRLTAGKKIIIPIE